MISGIFVAGTGTDVGKTIVTAGLLRRLRRRSSKPSAAMVMKPVQTGCEADAQGKMRAPDVEFVLRAAELEADEETLAHVAPYCFEPACSPHLAARMAGQRIEMEKILASAEWLAKRYRRLVVEAAGGLLVPINENQMTLCVAWQMRLPVLLVAHSGLGTINHTLLSLEALRRCGCRVLGVILNDTQPVAEAERFICDENVRAIEHYGEVAVRRMPYLRSEPTGPVCWNELDSTLDQCEFLREYL